MPPLTIQGVPKRSTIFELNGDELTVCYDLEGRERPASMQAQPDQLLLRITYTRAAILFS